MRCIAGLEEATGRWNHGQWTSTRAICTFCTPSLYAFAYYGAVGCIYTMKRRPLLAQSDRATGQGRNGHPVLALC